MVWPALSGALGSGVHTALRTGQRPTGVRRRVIFQDASETVSIYDSLHQALTLYETARLLKEQYAAAYALNLDMGPYGYCGRYDNNERVALYGGKGQNIELTNVLVFNYK